MINGEVIMAEWQPDEKFLEFILKESEAQRDNNPHHSFHLSSPACDFTQPFYCGFQPHDMNLPVQQMRKGTLIGKLCYKALYRAYKSRFEEEQKK